MDTEETDRRWLKIREFPAHSGTVNAVCLKDDKVPLLATGGSDKKVNLWDMEKPNCLNSLVGHVTPVVSVRFSLTQTHICAGSQGGVLKIWDYVSSKNLRTLMGHRASIRCSEYHPHGGLLISGSSDSSIKLWDIRKRDCISGYKGHNSAVNVLKFSPDGRYLGSGGEDHRVKLWDLRNGKVVHEFCGHRAPISSLAFHPEGALLSSCSVDQTFKIYNLETSSIAASIATDGRPNTFILSHPDGKSLFVASEEVLGVYGWDQSCPRFDSVAPTWPKIQEMIVVGNTLICTSSKRETVALATVNLKCVKCEEQKEDPEKQEEIVSKNHPNHLNCENKSPVCEGKIPEHKLDETYTIEPEALPSVLIPTLVNLNTEIPDCIINNVTPAENENNFKLLTSKTTDPPNECNIESHKSDLVPVIITSHKDVHLDDEQNKLNDNQTPDNIPNSEGELKASLPSQVVAETRELPPSAREKLREPPPLDLSSRPPISSRPYNRSKPILSARISKSESVISRKQTDSLSGIQGFSNTNSRPSSTLDPKEVNDELFFTPISEIPTDLSCKAVNAEEKDKVPPCFQNAPVQSKSDIKINTDFASKIWDPDPNNPSLSPPVRDLMNLNHTNMAKSTLNPNEILYNLSEEHKAVIAALGDRKRNLQALHQISKTKDMRATAEAAFQFNDITIVVDILEIFSHRPSLWTLDLCVTFLPAIQQLLQSRCEEHVKCGKKTLRIMLAHFESVIKDSIGSPEALGVDLCQEARRQKSMTCRQHLISIREFATNKKSQRDKFGHIFNDILVLLSNI